MEYFWAVFYSILPISELRGGIPYAISMEINPVAAYLLCVGANLLAFPITYFFLEFLHPVFLKMNWYTKLFDKFIVRTRKKIESKIERWGFWGLMVFVMIPLPVTGAYTGSFAAWLFNIKKRHAFTAVTLGVMIAGLIVLAVSIMGVETFKLFTKEV